MPQEAVETIIQDNEAALLRYAWRYLHDDASAQDAVQVAFVKYVHYDKVIFNPRAWLFRAVRNHCLNILKQQQRRPEISLEHATEQSKGDSDAPDVAMINRENGQIIRSCIDKLKPKYKEVVILKLEHGRSYREIAMIMQATVSNVGVMLHEAMKQLRSDLAEELVK
jgi:RNA polymerase sigma-70 factor (ECF subfamily)